MAPTVSAQQTLDNLLTDYKSWSQEAKQTPTKTALRKQDRATVKLANYIEEYGYPLTLAASPAQKLVVYEQPYPILGKVLYTLDSNEKVQVYEKDEHGYYRIGKDGVQGYVYGVSSQFKGDHDLWLLLDEMLARKKAVNKMLEQARARPRMRVDDFGGNQGTYQSNAL